MYGFIPFSDAELDRIFGSLDTTGLIDPRDHVLLHTLWDTGMREGDLVNLTLGDLDLARQTLCITHAKFGKWRDSGFGKETHKYLTRYLALCRPEPAVEGDRRLFLAFDGYPLREATVQNFCQRLSKRIGVHIHARHERMWL